MFITVDDVLNKKKRALIFGTPQIVIIKDELTEVDDLIWDEIRLHEIKVNSDGWTIGIF